MSHTRQIRWKVPKGSGVQLHKELPNLIRSKVKLYDRETDGKRMSDLHNPSATYYQIDLTVNQPYQPTHWPVHHPHQREEEGTI